MMFKHGLVAIIKANGKIVRDIDDQGSRVVYLPYGTEYSIEIKNEETRKASVSISVDGKDVLKGSQVVVYPNSSTEVKGFLDPSSNVAKNSFRFIEQTEKIKNHLGESISDGIVRIEFQFEKPEPERIPVPVIEPYPVPYPYPSPLRPWKIDPWKVDPWDRLEPRWTLNRIDNLDNSNHSKGFQCNVRSSDRILRSQNLCQPADASSCQLDSLDLSDQTFNERGITVAGSHVNQQFHVVPEFKLEATKHAIIFELRGKKTTGEKVSQPLLSRKKVECPSCGTKSVSSAKFCSECTTALV